MVGAFESFGVAGKHGIQHRALQEHSCSRKPGIEINRGENGFVRVGEEPLLIAAASFFFALPQTKKVPKFQFLRRGVQRSGAHHAREALGKLSGIPIGK